MKFTKMQGLGNDYVYLDCTKSIPENAEELAKKLSDRHFAVGADGLILIASSDVADFQMIMYNADGSRSQMCGNGIRCVGKYVRDKGLTDKDEISVETLAGIKHLKFSYKNGKVDLVTVDMGEPVLTPAQIPTTLGTDRAIKENITVLGKTYQTTCVSMGNPHSVVFLENEDVDTFDLDTIGAAFESHEAFPERVNAEFAQIIAPNTIKMRVYERGTGETMACGTGACATHTAAFLNNLVGEKSTVCLPGGDLKIEWNGSGSLFMTGPAEFSFEGEIDL